jgi:hypothetical protein
MIPVNSSVALARQVMYKGGGLEAPAVFAPKKLAVARLDSNL